MLATWTAGLDLERPILLHNRTTNNKREELKKAKKNSKPLNKAVEK